MHLPTKIGIIGTGLIGGSIAKALKKRAEGITIASLKRECPDLLAAKNSGVVDQVFETWEELIAFCDWIILATPLSSLDALARQIAARCPPEKNLLVLDVSSVKKAVFPAFETLTTENLHFLSTHPMAGKEKWGFAHSDADLFEGCCWIVSPHEKNTTGMVDAVIKFVEALGARSKILDPLTHDKQVALISHLPALLSRLLLQFVEGEDKEALSLAGPGFHSMTRLAKDNPELQREIHTFNKEEIGELFSRWLEFLNEVKTV